MDRSPSKTDFVTSILPSPRTPDKRGYSGARGLAPPVEQVLPGARHFGFDHDYDLILVNTVRLEGLAVYLRRPRLQLRPHRRSSARRARRLPSATMTSASPSLIEFGSRGSPSTFGDHDFGFALVDGVRLEALSIYLRRPRLWLCSRRRSSARGARCLPSATTTSPLLSSTEFGSRGSPSTFGDHNYAFALVDGVRF